MATQTKPRRAQVVLVHPDDDVIVAVHALTAGETVEVGGEPITLASDVPAGHKIARRRLDEGAHVRRYGHVIGRASAPVEEGAHVHSHNLDTRLEGEIEYQYAPQDARPVEVGSRANGSVPTFEGYRRPDGRVGTRNEIWIVNTVGCVNTAARRIARFAEERTDALDHVDGVHSFSHPYGCSQLGDDLEYTQKALAGLIRHPNAGGVLVLGLGCENNQMEDLLAQAGEGVRRERIRFFNSQEVLDEVEEGLDAVQELAELMKADRRETCPVTDLVVGVKCGGSDAFSGLTANPLVGRLTDRLTGLGAPVLQTEVPEMFGAEESLLNRAIDEGTFESAAGMINGFKRYFRDHDQPVYENPSPGNKEGGLTTLEEKSLGAVQKGGQAQVTQILDYAEAVDPETGGLALVYGPGNDGVSSTNMVAAGATLLLFTTGRGTPLGFPAPTLKISSNTEIAEKKPHWIDFDAGRLLAPDADPQALDDEFFDLVRRVASGEKRANNEEADYREIAIWKGGVTL
jgi:altronate hydrolase